MKLSKNSIILVFAAAILVAGVVIAGCTQASDSGPASSGTSQQVSPTDTGTGSPSDNGGSQTGSASGTSTGANPSSGNGGSYSGSYSGNTSRQYQGQGFLTNDTLMNAAATQLGVSEQDLKTALTPANGTRLNLTDAAQQLGVTPQQLRSALGFGAYGGYHGNRTTAPATTTGSGQ
jgi:hypothetical protein